MLKPAEETQIVVPAGETTATAEAPAITPANGQDNATEKKEDAQTVPVFKAGEMADAPTFEQKEREPSDVTWETGGWQAVGEAAVGLAHVRKSMPCQDAVHVKADPRLCLVAADGAGSALVSELGAQGVVNGMARVVDTFDRQIGRLLDHPQTSQNEANDWALLLVKHARGLLEDIASLHRRSIRDVRCTLLIFIGGAEQGLWLKVGDGSLVIEQRESIEAEPLCQTLGGLGKGEFANETVFLDSVEPSEVQWGLVPMRNISGAAVMSDGAAERLVSQDGKQVSARMTTLFASLRQEQLQRSDLTKMFYAPDFCDRSTGDDRCLAIAARTLIARPKPKPESKPVETVKARARADQPQTTPPESEPLSAIKQPEKAKPRRSKRRKSQK